jgi:hypothetical protein
MATPSRAGRRIYLKHRFGGLKSCIRAAHALCHRCSVVTQPRMTLGLGQEIARARSDPYISRSIPQSSECLLTYHTLLTGLLLSVRSVPPVSISLQRHREQQRPRRLSVILHTLYELLGASSFNKQRAARRTERRHSQDAGLSSCIVSR